MMNKIMKKVLCVILMILALILGYQYISNRKTKEENKIERNDDVVRLDFEEISPSSIPETIYEEQKQRNNVQKETLSGNRYFDAMEAYKDILAEYELAQKTEDESYIPEQWQYVDRQMFYTAKEYLLYYCLSNLSEGNTPQLIIGIIMIEDETPYPVIYTLAGEVARPIGTAYYDPWYIYSYNKEGKIEYIERGGSISIYEGGIIETARAGYAYYWNYQKDSGELELLHYLEAEAKIQDGEVTSRNYYGSTQGSENKEEISENEYWKYTKQYTSKPMELEWMRVEGFLEGYSGMCDNQIQGRRGRQIVTTGNRYFDEMDAYKAVLAEYEMAQKTADGTGMFYHWENINDLLLSISREKKLYYSLADLTGDGHMELIMGAVMKELPEAARPLRITPKLIERSAEAEYYDPWVIYSYSEEGGIERSCERGAYELTIYEGGIVEMSRAWNTYYYQYQKDSGKLCFLDHFDITAEIQNNKVVSRTYYRVMQDDNRNEELSETEYWKYIKQYTSNPVELEWMLVEGFCDL